MNQAQNARRNKELFADSSIRRAINIKHIIISNYIATAFRRHQIQYYTFLSYLCNLKWNLFDFYYKNEVLRHYTNYKNKVLFLNIKFEIIYFQGVQITVFAFFKILMTIQILKIVLKRKTEKPNYYIVSIQLRISTGNYSM